MNVERRSPIKRVVRLLLFIVLGSVSVFQWNIIRMPLHYALSSTASVHYGEGEQLLLVDNGKLAVEVLDGGGSLVKHWPGGTLDGFFYAEQAATAPDGTIYLADRAYRTLASGVTAMVERVIEFHGRDRRVVWEEQAPESNVSQNSTIFELQFYEGRVWFLRKESSSLAVYSFEPGKKAALKYRVFLGETINDASYDISSEMIVIVTRRGFLRYIRAGELVWLTIPADAEHLMPASVTARSGQVYLSDAFANRICRFSLDAPQDGMSTFWQEGVHIIDVTASADGREVLASDGAGFYRIRDGAAEYVSELTYTRYPLTLLCRAALIAALLMLLWFLWGLLPMLKEMLRSEAALRVIIVVLAVVSVAVFVAYSLMTELFAQEDNAMLENMKLFAEIMRDGIDKTALADVKWEQDYESAAYKRVRGPMDNMIRLAYAEQKEYYYVLYRMDGDTMRMLMNSDDYVMCGEPYDLGDQDYSAEVQRTGVAYALRTRAADGDWVNVMIPVTDDNGIRFAVLEVGMDMGLLSRQRQDSAIGMALSVVCSTAVVMMLILEGVFLISFLERRRSLGGLTAPGPASVPVRTLICFSYMADSMQEPFIAVLCTELYRGGLPLPDIVAAALPMSGQLLAMALSSTLAGSLSERFGSRRIMTAGAAAQMAGSICCFMIGSYPGIFVGKLLIGVGMGILYVACNTVASAGETEEIVGEAFAGISAGTLSGMSIGAGLASLFLSIGGWRVVYMVGAVLMVGALALSLSSGDVHLGAKERTAEPAIGFAKFFLNRRVMGFFLLILVPFMMSLSYREYFFPIFAQDYGLGEVRIGQIYLLCGLMVLYLGPGLTAWLLRTIGALWSIIGASVLMGLGMLIFVIHPSMGSVLLGVVMVYAVFSFSSSCQYTYFQSLPECVLYGEGKSMGVYSMFESVGQTLGPVSYSTLLVLGNQAGIGVFCGVMLLLTAAFVILMWQARKFYR